MLVYGSRMYFKSNKVKTWGNCQYCGAYGQQSSYQGMKFGHLYFIPLLPLGGKSQVLNECSACDMGAHISLKELEPRLDELKEQFKSWIMEIQNGSSEITIEGAEKPVNAGVLIAGILEDLYCLKEIESVDSISEILSAGSLQYENSIVQGRWSEIQGDLPGAVRHYETAHHSRPEDPAALFQLGTLEVKQGNASGAEAAFAKYSELEPEDISPYIELASLYEAAKDWGKIVSSYDKLYSMNPALIKEKPMKKVYKKACKKSGVPGQYLDQM